MLVIGCGIAGCTIALLLAEQGVDILLISTGDAPEVSNSFMAQGGIVFRNKDDESDSLLRNMIGAGAGLVNPAAAQLFVKEGPELVQKLLIEQLQVPFARNTKGDFLLAKEAAHSRSRILYHADETGYAIMQRLLEKVKNHPRISLKIGHTAVDLITNNAHSLTCCGAYVLDHRNVKMQ